MRHITHLYLDPELKEFQIYKKKLEGRIKPPKECNRSSLAKAQLLTRYKKKKKNPASNLHSIPIIPFSPSVKGQNENGTRNIQESIKE